MLEWTFVLAVVSRVARLILVPIMLSFQIGIIFAMSIHVGETWLMLTFIDVDGVARWLARRGRRDGAVTQPAPAR